MKPIVRFFNRFKPDNLRNAVTCLVIAALLLVAGVLSGVESAQGGGADLTANGVFTLSEKSEELLSSLEQDICIYTLYSPGNENKTITALLKKFAAKSDSLSIANVDPSGSREDISFAEGASTLAVGSIVVALADGSRYTTLSSGSLYVTDRATGETSLRAEGKLVTAINYVATGNTINVKFLYGHQETADSELSEMRAYLDSMNYELSRFDYLRSSEPLDPATDILIAVSPKTDLTAEEYKGISRFMSEGGTFIVLMDNAYYDISTGNIERVQRNQKYFSRLLSDYALGITENIVACADASKTGFRSTTLPLDADTTYMRKLASSGGSAVFSECASIDCLEDEGVSVIPLLFTCEDCYMNSTRYNLTLAESDSSEKGSFIVGAMAAKDKGTLVLFSTSSFLRSSEFMISANSAVLIDALSFADVGSPAVETEPRALFLTFSFKSELMRVLWVILLAVLPTCGVLAAGVLRLAKRKHLRFKFKKR